MSKVHKEFTKFQRDEAKRKHKEFKRNRPDAYDYGRNSIINQVVNTLSKVTYLNMDCKISLLRS